MRNILSNKFSWLAFFSIVFLATACEDVIDVELEEGDNQLVVDAWINDLDQNQIIKLRRTSPYFDASFSPAETGATVTITESDGTVYNFLDANNNGDYTWTPSGGNTFGTVGNGFQLDIELSSGKTFQSFALKNRTTPVDSIAVEFREEELGQPEGFYCEFFGRDPVGPGDTYWIKTFKNGEFLNKPSEINIAFDASFTPGAMVDGVTFITPIRSFVNRIPDSGDDATDTNDIAPWAEGDSIRVEIHSLNFVAFEFIEQAQTQLTLGDAGIFAEPPANVPTNIISLDGTDAADVPVGFFNVSSVSSMERRIE